MELKGSERLGLGPAVAHRDRPGAIDPVAIRKLELEPQEAFLLSRIDGAVTLSDLCLMCGFELAQGKATVERLVRLRVLVRLDHVRSQSRTAKLPRGKATTPKIPRIGTTTKIEEDKKPRGGRGNSKTVKIGGGGRKQAITPPDPRNQSLRARAKTRKMDILRRQIHGAGRRSEPADRVPLVSVSVSCRPDSRPSQQQSRAPEKAGTAQKGARPRSTTCPIDVPSPEPVVALCWEAVVVDETRLDKNLGISVERQRSLLQMSSLLSELSPFELLAIPYCDEPDKIRRAFHQQSRWLHPDAYHGKDLGPYRDMLEQVFSRVRQGYEELQSEQSRRRYAATG